jgi:drug/metabolite transporter (DMT)-like permease
LIAVALALGATLSWGVSDFLGGLMTRRMAVLAVIVISQTAGLTVIAIAVAAAGESAPDAAFIPYAAAAGLAGVCGLAAFYSALATGKMSVVAPISSMAVLVPVAVGLATGDRPSAVQAVGVVLGIAGIVLASREAVEGQTDRRISAGVGLALLSALGFGSFFVGMDVAADHDPLWANLVNRGTSLSLAVLAFLVFRPGFAGVDRGVLPALLTIGVLEMSANVAFAFAATEGLLSLTSVLSALYPVVVVVLAWLVLHERLQQSQKVGVAAALVGVALIAGG